MAMVFKIFILTCQPIGKHIDLFAQSSWRCRLSVSAGQHGDVLPVVVLTATKMDRWMRVSIGMSTLACASFNSRGKAVLLMSCEVSPK